MLLFLIEEIKRCCHTTWLPLVAKMNTSFGWHSYLLSFFCTIVLYIFRKHFLLLVLSTTKIDLVPEAGNWDLLLGGSHSAVEIVMEDGAACLRLSSPHLPPWCNAGGLHTTQHGSIPHSLPSWDLFHPTLSLHCWGRKDTPSESTTLPNSGEKTEGRKGTAGLGCAEQSHAHQVLLHNVSCYCRNWWHCEKLLWKLQMILPTIMKGSLTQKATESKHRRDQRNAKSTNHQTAK